MSVRKNDRPISQPIAQSCFQFYDRSKQLNASVFVRSFSRIIDCPDSELSKFPDKFDTNCNQSCYDASQTYYDANQSCYDASQTYYDYNCCCNSCNGCCNCSDQSCSDANLCRIGLYQSCFDLSKTYTCRDQSCFDAFICCFDEDDRCLG